jgi:hypothetical protein
MERMQWLDIDQIPSFHQAYLQNLGYRVSFLQWSFFAKIGLILRQFKMVSNMMIVMI